VSIGIVEHRPSDPIDRTLSRADAALYEAKHRGRNCVVCGDSVWDVSSLWLHARRVSASPSERVTIVEMAGSGRTAQRGQLSDDWRSMITRGGSSAPKA
jgi:hypothetical protein